jgi:hypothetical protein
MQAGYDYDHDPDQAGQARSHGLRRLSRLTWRATQLSALATVGFAVLFARTAPAATVSSHPAHEATPKPSPSASPSPSPSPSVHRHHHHHHHPPAVTAPGAAPGAAPSAAPSGAAPAPSQSLAPPTTPPAPPPSPAPSPQTTSSPSHGGG